MTELEYEKAARGLDGAVNGEYAWGSTNYTAASGLNNSGKVNEVPSNALANIAINSLLTGPVRNGSFSSLNYGTISRELAGGSYYGALEMSGNVREPVVSVGNATGRSYTGSHGNGTIDSSGNADVSAWPTTSGYGVRGGSWGDVPERARTSDRNDATSEFATRSNLVGARGVRGVP